MTTLDDARRFFAEEIRAVANLQSEVLVEALAKVPREAFLGDGPWEIAVASARRPGALTYRRTRDADPRNLYHNVLVAIDASRELNNGQPSALAASLDLLGLRPGETFVHIGCGVGYYSAIGANLVGISGRVLAVELDPDLAARAKANLAGFGQ